MATTPTPATPKLVPPTSAALVVAHRIIAALEAANMRDAADIARSAAGLPPRTLTPDEQFVATVRALVVGSSPVGFNCADSAECARREALVTSMAPVNGRRYSARRDASVPTRLEVSLG